MTHKVHPLSNRLTIIKDWKSRWLDLKHYQTNVQQDYFIREFIFKNFRTAGIADIEIDRSPNHLSIIILTSRPGILIGRGGTGIEEMRKNIMRILYKKSRERSALRPPNQQKEKFPELRIEVREVREIDAHARLVALSVVEQLERRMPFRRIIKRALDRVMANKEVQGAKILVKGRLNGAEMARSEFVKAGNLPLQTLRADIDYAHVDAMTKYGTIGVKVWIYKGEKLD